SSVPTCAQQCTHLCPAVRPPVPPSSVTTCAQNSATHLCPPTCAHQCYPPVHISAAQQFCQSVPPSVPSSAASQCPAVMSVSATYQYPLSVSPISATNQCRISVPP
ncbi:unnamed protein product, partial [Staurois parvus]